MNFLKTQECNGNNERKLGQKFQKFWYFSRPDQKEDDSAPVPKVVDNSGGSRGCPWCPDTRRFV